MFFRIGCRIFRDVLLAFAKALQIGARERRRKFVNLQRIVDGFDRAGDEIALARGEKLELVFNACGAFADVIRCGRTVLFIVDASAHFGALNVGVDEFIERPLRVIEPHEKKVREREQEHHKYGDDNEKVAGD